MDVYINVINDDVLEVAMTIDDHNGWIGVGFDCPTGMTDCDISIGWVDGSTIYFHDYFGFGSGIPELDSEIGANDYEVGQFVGEKVGSRLSFKFLKNFTFDDDGRDATFAYDRSYTMLCAKGSLPSGGVLRLSNGHAGTLFDRQSLPGITLTESAASSSAALHFACNLIILAVAAILVVG